MMELETNRLVVRFTFAELMYAASLMGFGQLYLLNINQQSDLSAWMKTGRESLSARSLIHTDTIGVTKIDELLYTLVHWIAAPEWAIKFSIQRSSSAEQFIVFYQEGYLCSRQIEEVVELILFRNPENARDYIFQLAGFNQKTSTVFPPFDPRTIKDVCDLVFYYWERSLPVQKGTKRFLMNDQYMYIEEIKNGKKQYIPMNSQMVSQLELI
jgi:hypothetical protein